MSLAVYERTLLRRYERTSMSVRSYVPTAVLRVAIAVAKRVLLLVLFTLGFRHLVGSVFCEGKEVA